MARKSLRPHLNQIRAWVRQGRTDAWVAHQLEVTVRDIEQFKRQNELVSDAEPTEGAVAADYPDEVDLRAEDDALIAAELEAAEVQAEREQAEGDEEEDDGRGRPCAPAGEGDAEVAGVEARAAAGARWRARSTTARRVTVCGSTQRSRTIRSTPSTGRGIARSRSPSKRTA